MRSTGSIQAHPNPTVASDSREGPVPMAATTLSWTSQGAKSVQVHVDSPDGPLLAHTGPQGSAPTGSWVRDGMVFYLQDVSDGKELTPNHTLATVAVRVSAPPRRSLGPATALILMYHRVASVEQDPWLLCVTPQHFAEHLDVLDRDARPVSLAGMVRGLRNEAPLRGSVVVTFDDGYADSLYAAKPLLERCGVPATMFVVSGVIGAHREFWWDELERILFQPGVLPKALRLCVNGSNYDWDLGETAQYTEEDYRRYRYGREIEQHSSASRQALYHSLHQLLQPLVEGERLKALDELLVQTGGRTGARAEYLPLSNEELTVLAQADLIDIGAHTVTHPFLPGIPPAAQRSEIERGKVWLEQAVGHPVNSFAYPYGGHTAETVGLVREIGFACACSTVSAGVAPNADPFRLPRLAVQDWDGEEFSRHLNSWFAGTPVG
jgi:peptidoglycan/xylan/chitin deacetylase (PgdA/CDA1 family)